MSDQITVEGKDYISSKRASEISGYSQDYIGQLARKQLIDAKRIGGLWYVMIDSLTSHQKKAEEYKPQPPVYRPEMNAAPDTVVSFDGKDYVSAARAAEITKYHQDYVGQLARSGTIISRQIGNRWYVDREAIVAHKKEKDGLLAAVQAESVGIPRAPQIAPEPLQPIIDYQEVKYFSYSGDLMPRMSSVEPREAESEPSQPFETPEPVKQVHVIPIRREQRVLSPIRVQMPVPRHRKSSKSTSVYALVGALATIVIVLAVGFTSLRGASTYAFSQKVSNTAASIGGTMGLARIADFIEAYLVPELQYHRQDE